MDIVVDKLKSFCFNQSSTVKWVFLCGKVGF